jgi:mannose-1-phosphate guanylyltransferase/mannose-6-phosphate isomerase
MTQIHGTGIQNAQPLANLHVIIICSNSASHLWPLSRAHAPLELVPDAQTGLSPLAQTIRAAQPFSEHPLIIATPHDIAHFVKRHIDENRLLAPEDYRLLIEPHPRGTALTVALAAAMIKLTDPLALLLSLQANIAFAADDRWAQTLGRAYSVALTDRIALIGSSVPPQGFLTNERSRMIALRERQLEQSPPLLGTIRMGSELKDVEGAYQVRSFIARPAPVLSWRAEQNKSLWSTHIFLLKADLVLAELRAAGREASDPVMQSVQRIAETARFFVSLGSEHWETREANELVKTLPALTFEEAVFETTKILAAIPTSIEFADLTTLSGYERSLDADAKGNRLRGRTLAVQSRDTTVLADGGKLVVTLGLEDALVIDTPDATLVTTREALGAMPSVMAALRAADAPEL